MCNEEGELGDHLSGNEKLTAHHVWPDRRLSLLPHPPPERNVADKWNSIEIQNTKIG